MITSSATMVVTQNDDRVNITPIVTVFGEPLDILPFTGTVDMAGVVSFDVDGLPLNDPPDPECGGSTLDTLTESFIDPAMEFELDQNLRSPVLDRLDTVSGPP